MTFVSNDSVRIEARGVSKTYHYAEIGFKDGRTADKADSIWEFFHALACLDSEASWDNVDKEGRTLDLSSNKVEARVRRLRKRLREVMGLDDDPFDPYHKVNAYRTRFTLRDDTQDCA